VEKWKNKNKNVLLGSGKEVAPESPACFGNDDICNVFFTKFPLVGSVGPGGVVRKPKPNNYRCTCKADITQAPGSGIGGLILVSMLFAGS